MELTVNDGAQPRVSQRIKSHWHPEYSPLPYELCIYTVPDCELRRGKHEERSNSIYSCRINCMYHIYRRISLSYILFTVTAYIVFTAYRYIVFTSYIVVTIFQEGQTRLTEGATLLLYHTYCIDSEMGYICYTSEE